MRTQLFIPDTIKVGYQSRKDTYTGKLAYVIYYDKNGKLRKEKSWKSWTKEELGSNDFDNKPRSGFILNKGVQRWAEYFGTGRNMVRVFDDRGFEFEITVENLLFILANCDCVKREISGKLIYAWEGTELRLIPVCCEEYKKCYEYSDLQGQKISFKDLKIGCSYKTKKQQNLIYLGRFNWIGSSMYTSSIKSSKKHVFVDEQGEWVSLSNNSSLASLNSDIPVDNYAELAEKYTNSERCSKFLKIVEAEPTQDNSWYKINNNYCVQVVDENSYYRYILTINNGTISKIHEKNPNYKYNYTYRRINNLNETPLDCNKKVSLHVELESGRVLDLNDYYKIYRGY